MNQSISCVYFNRIPFKKLKQILSVTVADNAQVVCQPFILCRWVTARENGLLYKMSLQFQYVTQIKMMNY